LLAECLLADDSKELARVGPGQCFGELALMSGDLRAANVMALDNSVVRTGCFFVSR
jgi:CRP-like cAMP-binding protein